jgi:DNA topoisomerase VI subunit A
MPLWLHIAPASCVLRYLLIVEKDAVFQRLAEDGLPDALPLVMVTAKGMPDLATRAFCSRLLVGVLDFQ